MAPVSFSSLEEVNQKEASVNQTNMWPRKFLYLDFHWVSEGVASWTICLRGRRTFLMCVCFFFSWCCESPAKPGFIHFCMYQFHFTRENSWVASTSYLRTLFEPETWLWFLVTRLFHSHGLCTHYTPRHNNRPRMVSQKMCAFKQIENIQVQKPWASLFNQW